MLVTNNGPVLGHAHIVPVFFADENDPTVPLADMNAFYEGIGATPLWAAAEQYGVHAPSGVTPVILAENAPLDVDDVDLSESELKQWLTAKIASGELPENVEGTTLYVL